jgi:hypothetical protein
MSMRMRAEVDETVEAVPVVGMEALDQRAVVGRAVAVSSLQAVS